LGNEKKGKEVNEIVKRILLVLTVAAVMAAMLVAGASVVFADPNCTGPPGGRPGACHEPGGPPGPGNFVGPGGGSSPANHHHHHHH
jgi:hypothetical protein